MLKPLSPKNKGKTYPGSIVRTYHLLNGMLKDKEVEQFRNHNNEPYIWFLPENPPPPHNWYSRQHEIDIGDLFVAFYPHITHWDTKWTDHEKEKLNIPRYRVHYDARMVLNGKVYLWEVDRGTEEIDVQLEPKVDKYIDLAHSLPYGAFQVLFTLQKYRKMNLENRAGKLAEMLAEKKRGNQFLFGVHSEVLTNPLGEVFASPLDPLKRINLAA